MLHDNEWWLSLFLPHLEKLINIPKLANQWWKVVIQMMTAKYKRVHKQEWHLNRVLASWRMMTFWGKGFQGTERGKRGRENRNEIGLKQGHWLNKRQWGTLGETQFERDRRSLLMCHSDAPQL
jgi:hypothetical protein